MRPKVRKGLHGRKGELSMNKKKLPLAFWIFIGLVVGIAVGLALMMVPNGLDIAKNYILPWGTIFLNLLKFIVVPIVLFSPASRMPKPTRREMTMTWSMEALASGVMGLEGKMSMMVCISDWPAGGS